MLRSTWASLPVTIRKRLSSTLCRSPACRARKMSRTPIHLTYIDLITSNQNLPVHCNSLDDLSVPSADFHVALRSTNRIVHCSPPHLRLTQRLPTYRLFVVILRPIRSKQQGSFWRMGCTLNFLLFMHRDRLSQQPPSFNQPSKFHKPDVWNWESAHRQARETSTLIATLPSTELR
jgi:hypothetical protein